MNRILKAIALCAPLFCLAASGCGAKEYFNCRTICNKNKTCDDSSYNVDKCIDTCSDSANSDDNYARMVNTCKECVEPLSCGDDAKLAACWVNCPKNL